MLGLPAWLAQSLWGDVEVWLEKKEGGCWEFFGARTWEGYGQIVFRGVPYYTHRVAWINFNGELAEGLEVCHRCDNPPCCNPTHLFVGTHLDNMRDKVRKGRCGKRTKKK